MDVVNVRLSRADHSSAPLPKTDPRETYPVLPASIIERGDAVFPQPPGGTVILQPGQGFVMGLIWGLTPDYRFITIVVGQALLDALTCLLAFAVGRQLWGPAGGIAGAVGYAIFTPQAQLTAYAGSNVWAAPLLLLLCWQLSKTPASLSGLKRFWIYNAMSVGIVLGIAR